jgi:starch synthase
LQVRSVREAARKLVASHVPDEVVANKHHWMVVLVPERPVAGEELVIYFNRNASDALR